MENQNNRNKYQEFLKKLDGVTNRRQPEELSTSTPSPTVSDLWRTLQGGTVTSSTFACPHCPHCSAALTPQLPQSSPDSLLTSLNSHQTELQFLNAIVWMTSIMSAFPVVPISQMKRTLKALVEIEENPPPRLSIQKKSSVKGPGLGPEGGLSSPRPPVLSMTLEVSPGLRKTRGKNTSSSGGEQQQRDEEIQAKKRKLEGQDSAVVLEGSPGRTWVSCCPEELRDNEWTLVIAESDGEDTQMTPDIDFESFSGNRTVKDSGICEDVGKILEEVQEACELVEQEQEVEEEEEVISSLEFSGILREFPTHSVAISIVKSTLEALENEDTVEYCWKERPIVEQAIKVILRFIDIVAVEEYKCPGYLDFFVKFAVQTVVNVIQGFDGLEMVDVKRQEHLMTILELCNCRLICEKVVWYLMESLSSLSDENSTREDPLLMLSWQEKSCLLIETLTVTLEKYLNIIKVNNVQPLDFFHRNTSNSTRELLNAWSTHVDNFVEKNLHTSVAKVSLVKNIFRKFRTKLESKLI
ncbi:uncharacterized protein [Fopius arisanus]|uniref:Uncharacterized protein n=1 Tax=Fopius arisanus TaxID=64838 RepID=A0A9R1T627_9HYME|nr:PREDICTED: uncharacterized protein LOC105266759 [Fopius arisanus]